MGKNPYRDGSVGSYSWKTDRGKPLTPEEQRLHAQLTESSRSFNRWLESSKRLDIASSYYGLVRELADNLPKAIRDDLMTTPLAEVAPKIKRYLPLASTVSI